MAEGLTYRTAHPLTDLRRLGGKRLIGIIDLNDNAAQRKENECSGRANASSAVVEARGPGSQVQARYL
jgi:hypothetical protein